jgi:hypothetical protein
MTEEPSVLIALPAYGNTLDADTAVSLANLAHWLTAKGIRFDMLKVDYGDIAEARNFLASFFLHKTPHSHLLFIDSDMIFRPSLVQKMLALNSPIVGAIAPVRRDQKDILLNVTGLRDDGTCERIGAALMLIERDALTALAPTVRTFTEHLFGRLGYDGPLHGFFDRQITETDWVGEDHAFCDRWRDTGGTIHAVDDQVGHVSRTVLRSA